MPNVLIVDDIATDRLLAGGLFESDSKWTARFAENGKAGLDSIRRDPPDVVLTDLVMPEMDGLALVGAVVDEFPLIPVILMTSKGSEEVAVQALEAGAASYIPKRVLGRELLHVANRVVSAYQAEQSHAELMNYVNRDESVVLTNDLSLIASLINHLRQTFCSFGICDQPNSMRVATAIDEALTNAFYHGNLEVDSRLRESNDQQYYELAQQRCQESPFCDRRIHVTAQFKPSEASISIRDEGNGFDVSSLPDPTDPENLSRPYGRGVLLMRMFMDDVVYNSSGNEVTLRKQRAGVPA